MKKYYCGVDIGGTKVAISLVTPTGKSLISVTIPISSKNSTKQSVAQIIEMIRQCMSSLKIQKLGNKYGLMGVGVGTPGPVDSKSGKVPWSPNLPDWEGFNICSMIKRHLGVPVFITNDANAAALCEKHFGAGKKVKDLIYITASTGVGGGFILNGSVFSGHNFNAAEIGHMTIVPNGERCKCGNKGCLEAYASGTAIAREATKYARAHPKSVLARLGKQDGKISGKTVKAAFIRGDKPAKKILENAGYYLGVGVGSLINILNPEVIVFGGGVFQTPVKAANCVWKSMVSSAKEHSWTLPYKGCKLVQTKFPYEVGSLGAAALAIENLK